jgi:aryl-alcohol dehydrogenase-like predicted oxidoreductase
MMPFVNLGHSGLKVSRLCLGTMGYGTPKWQAWILDEEASRPFYREAVEAGITFFDTADMYSLGRSEEVLGRALKELNVSREHAVIATKVFNPTGDSPNQRGLSRKHIRHAVDDSLRRLGTDYIDLYQIHRLDHETPMDEILEALHDVVKAGKVLYLGASAMFSWQFMKMLGRADELGLTRFVSMQNYYNLAYREEEREMLPLCRAEDIAVLPFSPLARGFLAGNRKPANDEADTIRTRTDRFARQHFYKPQDYAVVDRLTEIAKARGISNSRLALAWVLHQPGVTAPIIAPTKPGHMADLIAALDVKLTAEELQQLAEPYVPHAVMFHS